MITAPVGVELRPLTIPASIDSPDAADFIEMVSVRNRVYREISGHDDHRIAADELLPVYQPDEHQRRLVWAVTVDGEMVGRAGVDLPLEGDSQLAFWLIELVRDVWGRGVGSAAYDLVERTARENGRTVLQSWAEHPDAPGPRLVAPTGFGTIPEDHAARFYVRHGYTLEQIERNSAFDLRGPFDEVNRLLAEATAASEGYRVVQWFAPTPDRIRRRLRVDEVAHGDGCARRGSRVRRRDVGCRARRSARFDLHRLRATAAGHRGAAHRHRRTLRLQRARHRQGPHRGLAPGGHARAARNTAVTSSERS